jgi:hypothetical protein
MPSMRNWTEIMVDEDLLIPVLRELLAVATNPNNVDVVHGTTGRVILAHVDVAEAWYQATLKKNQGDEGSAEETEKVAEEPIEKSASQPETVAVVEDSSVPVTELETFAMSEVDIAKVSATMFGTPAPLPVKRGPGRPRKIDSTTTSASNGEDVS